MAHEDLKDTITVSVTAKQPRFPTARGFSGMFKECESVVKTKIKRAKRELAPRTANRLADYDRLAQQNAIKMYGSIVDGTLFRSIRVTGTGGTRVATRKVGTSITRYFPHYVVYGRGPATAHNGGLLSYRDKNTGNWVVTRSVGAAKPRPYPQRAKGLFSPQIKGVVEEEVARVLS